MHRKNILNYFTSNSYLIIVLSFSYSLIISLVIYTILKNYFISNVSEFEELYGKIGFILPDSRGFHFDGYLMYLKMKEISFFIWEPFPTDCGTACHDVMVSIVALIYYLTVPSPYMMLIFNAVIQSMSAYILFLILNSIFQSKKISFFSTLFFIFFPSQFLWVSQIQRDGIFILGNLIYLYLVIFGIFLIKQNVKKNFFYELFKIYSLVFLTVLLIKLSRNYFIEVLNFLSILILIIVLMYFIFNVFKNKFSLKVLVLNISLPIFIFVNSFIINNDVAKETSIIYHLLQKNFQISLSNFNYNENDFREDSQRINFKKNTEKILENKNLSEESQITNLIKNTDNADIKNDDVNIKDLFKEGVINFDRLSDYELDKLEQERNFQVIRNVNWSETRWIPEYIDNKIKNLSFARLGFLSQSGRTSIDKHIVFKNSKEFIKYIPRALQIGYFSPFPNLLDFLNYDDLNTVLLNFIIVEPIILVLVLLLIFFNIKLLFFKIEYLIINIFCCSSIIIFCSTVNNIGTVIRMRYLFLTLSIAIIFSIYLKYIKKIKD